MPDTETVIKELRAWATAQTPAPSRISIYPSGVLIYTEDDTYILDRDELAPIHQTLTTQPYDYLVLTF